jgi:hypothetical protein
LKAPGFNPSSYKVKNRFRAVAFKCNLYRYIELTTPDAHFPPGELEGSIKALAAHFKKQCTFILAAVLERDVLQRLTEALSPPLEARALGRGPSLRNSAGSGGYSERAHRLSSSTGTGNRGMMDEEDFVMSSASAALKMVHNLLLYSDERSAQLRKNLMQSDMVTLVGLYCKLNPVDPGLKAPGFNLAPIK